MCKARQTLVTFIITGCEMHFSELCDQILHFANVTENLYISRASYEVNKIHDTHQPNMEVLHRHLQITLLIYSGQYVK
jgi:hypothetical protein